MIKYEKKAYCGVDVSKQHLDAFFNGKVKRFNNTFRGTESLVLFAGKAHYMFEPTEGYERLAAWTIMKAGDTVSPSFAYTH